MSEILTRLRGYNPPDRTTHDRRISQDIHDAADEIERLRAALAEAQRERDEWKKTCLRAEQESHRAWAESTEWKARALAAEARADFAECRARAIDGRLALYLAPGVAPATLPSGGTATLTSAVGPFIGPEGAPRITFPLPQEGEE